MSVYLNFSMYFMSTGMSVFFCLRLIKNQNLDVDCKVKQSFFYGIRCNQTHGSFQGKYLSPRSSNLVRLGFS